MDKIMLCHLKKILYPYQHSSARQTLLESKAWLLLKVGFEMRLVGLMLMKKLHLSPTQVQEELLIFLYFQVLKGQWMTCCFGMTVAAVSQRMPFGCQLFGGHLLQLKIGCQRWHRVLRNRKA